MPESEKPEVWDRLSKRLTRREPPKFDPVPLPRKQKRKIEYRDCPVCKGRLGHFEGCRLIGKWKLISSRVLPPPVYRLIENTKKLTAAELLAKLKADRGVA